ncbi:unnamed protein product [Brachionus calyciflorus]|uniref:Chitin-binding type-2 domain-containing protein n=1 Tax=Brachionus calyciflorus TaxID=104777 RepID=A0A814D4Z9_9BILA|nr:unnamed protein product [Brachionus calyciflorus]
MFKSIHFLALINIFSLGLSQPWRNEKIIRHWELNQGQLNGLGTLIASKIDIPRPFKSNQQSSQALQLQKQENHKQIVQPFIETSKQDKFKYFSQIQPNFNKPVQQRRPLQLPEGPYLIQQQTITSSGEVIIENLIGGIIFDCSAHPTGHWRDSKFCDVFHACVYGQQKKTYSCPFVGENTFFDEINHKCEFVRSNPSGCMSKTFFH